MRRLAKTGWVASLLAAALLLGAAAASAHDLHPPDYRGDPLSASFLWAEIDPGIGLFPEPVYTWVDDQDPTTIFWDGFPPRLNADPTGDTVVLDVPNFIDQLPLKLMRVQLTWTGSTTPPTIAGVHGNEGGMMFPGQVDFTSPLQPFTQPDGGYQYHDLSLRPNPDWEQLIIQLPPGVSLTQVVVDSISTVPEPGTMGLLAAAGLGLLVCVVRRRARAA